jgi:sulfur carrier protein ThiS
MKALVKIGGKAEEVVLKGGGGIMALLNLLGINPETVVVSKNGVFVPDDDIIEEGDELTVIKVVSGG